MYCDWFWNAFCNRVFKSIYSLAQIWDWILTDTLEGRGTAICWWIISGWLLDSAMQFIDSELVVLVEEFVGGGLSPVMSWITATTGPCRAAAGVAFSPSDSFWSSGSLPAALSPPITASETMAKQKTVNYENKNSLCVARKVTRGCEAQKLQVCARCWKKNAYSQLVHTPLSFFEHVENCKKYIKIKYNRKNGWSEL